MSDYIKLPRSALTDELWRNNGAMLRVYMFLVKISENGESFISVSQIHKATGLTERQIRDALTELERSNRMSSKRSNKGSNITLYDVDNNSTLGSSKRSNKMSSKRSSAITTTKPLAPDYISPPFVASEFVDTWRKFVEYRKEIRKPYKSESSERIAYNKMVEMANNDPETARDMVERTILGQWQGLFPKDNHGTKPITTTDNAASRKAQRDRGLSLANEIVARSENLLNLFNGSGNSDSDTCEN